VTVTVSLFNETKAGFALNAAKTSAFVRAFAAAIVMNETFVEILATTTGVSTAGSNTTAPTPSVDIHLSIATASDAEADSVIAKMQSDSFSAELVSALRMAGYPFAMMMTPSSVRVDKESVTKEVYVPDTADTADVDGGMPAFAIALIFVAVAFFGGLLGTVAYLVATGNLGLITGTAFEEAGADGKTVLKENDSDQPRSTGRLSIPTNFEGTNQNRQGLSTRQDQVRQDISDMKRAKITV